MTPEELAEKMLNSLPEKTGKSIDQWLGLLAKEQDLQKHGKIVGFLKAEFGIGHGYANLIAREALKSNVPVDLLSAQYGGGKEHLRPICDHIVMFANSLGNDVEVSPKKTSLSLRRSKQFALITPATKSRIDLGLSLNGMAAEGILEQYNSMCSHRIRIESLKDFSSEAKNLLQEAYDRAR